MAYIPQVDEGAARGLLKRIYDAARVRAGGVANIIRLMSLDARSSQASIQLYVTLMKSANGLNPATREMLATVVSNVNACFY